MTEATGIKAGARPGSDEDWASAMTPRMPDEGRGFDEIASGYHFGTIEDRRRLFAHMLVHELDRRASRGDGRVVGLDIGCGRGIGRSVRYQRAVRERCHEFWGIEPDPSVTPPEGMFDRYETALMETAGLPADSVDVAYSFMVMEHVSDPRGYFEAVRRVLKPGGAHLFMTVNANHYFTRIARRLHAMKLDEIVLKVVQRSSDDYHYPVAYKANDEAQIRAAAGPGWESIDFAYSEADAPSPYLPGPLKALAHRARARRVRGSDAKILLNLACRMRKASS